ncbi:MAG: hypothetical protein GXY65_18750 [Rhodococcus sp.]|uniref:hypothetical protein n=1 Tax=Rhodococcus TaxID=1827 RepID=UPI00169D075A|nr:MULTISPECIES: hypothetical protein [Rhodococcus]NLV81339.1 hypothetical protein [Rhodococcus sp. (in: high G+C Gram-positive bacteria)]
MLELFGVIVVWLTVAMVTIGCLLLVVVSTFAPHFLQFGGSKETEVERNTPTRS